MHIEPHVQEVANEYLAMIQQRPDHQFLPYYRARFLYETLSDYPTVRRYLAILTARKVLPIFDKDYGEMRMPARLLRLAERIAEGNLKKDSWRVLEYSELAYHVGGNGWGFFDDIVIVAYHAGHAASRALYEVQDYRLLKDVPQTIRCTGKAVDYTDYHLIAPDMDAASHAIHALALTDDDTLDPEKVLNFWTWWFTDALTDAFRHA